MLTGADALADGLKPIPHRPVIGAPDIALGKRDASDKFLSPHRVLPHDKARFAGEAVAVVVADSIAAAKDAAERVQVDYQPLPAVTDTVAAAAPDAPRLWDEASSNVCIDVQVGDAAATAAAFARAAHVVRLETWVQRVTGVPMEPRAAVGSFDQASGRYTLYAGSGGVVRQKHELATILGIPMERVRVVSGDVGGNFGTRNGFYPEFALVAWASRRVGRPVKWTCDRQEAFLSDYQGRDLFVDAELALDADGNFVALRGSAISNVGAHTVSFVPLTKGMGLLSSVYRIPAACFRARAVMSNTPPTNPYRSAGRPEAMFVIERLIDLAALRHGFDRIALRRQNLIGADAMPYSNPLGLTYDSGRYEQAMNAALALGTWDGFSRAARGGSAERQAPRHRHRQLRRVHHRGAARVDQGDRLAGRPRRGGDRHLVERARPSDQLRAAGDGLARRPLRLRELDPGRHRHHSGRRRLPFRPLHAARRHRHRQGVGRGDRQGQAHRRPRAGGGRARHRICRRPLHRARDRPLHRHIRGGAARPWSAAICRAS